MDLKLIHILILILIFTYKINIRNNNIILDFTMLQITIYLHIIGDT
jgi:hypothetical protein